MIVDNRSRGFFLVARTRNLGPRLLSRFGIIKNRRVKNRLCATRLRSIGRTSVSSRDFLLLYNPWTRFGTEDFLSIHLKPDGVKALPSRCVSVSGDDTPYEITGARKDQTMRHLLDPFSVPAFGQEAEAISSSSDRTCDSRMFPAMILLPASRIGASSV